MLIVEVAGVVEVDTSNGVVVMLVSIGIDVVDDYRKNVHIHGFYLVLNSNNEFKIVQFNSCSFCFGQNDWIVGEKVATYIKI
jgi:hypothetical protein